jgi:hypothetical protein
VIKAEPSANPVEHLIDAFDRSAQTVLDLLWVGVMEVKKLGSAGHDGVHVT